MQAFHIQGFTYELRRSLLADLTTALGNCGGWILERKTLSPTNMEFSVEIQLRAILDLYAALAATGVELTRSGHEVLTELCTRRQAFERGPRTRPDRRHPAGDRLPRRCHAPLTAFCRLRAGIIAAEHRTQG